MAVPILAFYLIGVVIFILGLEETEDKIRTIIYFGLSFFINYMGYTLSYQDTNYLDSAYLPLILMVFSVVMAIYTAWGMIPTKMTWSEKANTDDDD